MIGNIKVKKRNCETFAIKQQGKTVKKLVIETTGSPNERDNCVYWQYVVKADEEKVFSDYRCDAAEKITAPVAQLKSIIEALKWVSINYPTIPLEIINNYKIAVNIVNSNNICREPHIIPYCDEATMLVGKTKATVIWERKEKNVGLRK